MSRKKALEEIRLAIDSDEVTPEEKRVLQKIAVLMELTGRPRRRTASK